MNDMTTGFTKPGPMSAQVGGTHYKGLVIEPVELWAYNQLPGLESTAMKHITRHRDKNKRQDIEKAIDYINKMIWFYFDAEIRAVPLHFRGQCNAHIPTKIYCEKNNLPREETAAIELILEFSCRDHLVVAIELCEQIIQRDYSVPDPAALTLKQELYLVKVQIEHFVAVLETTAATDSQLQKAKRALEFLNTEVRKP